MKKLALIISLIAVFSLQGFAQKGSYSYGIKFGPTFDWASSGSTAANNKGMKMGFTFGGIIDHYFTRHVAFSSGLNFNCWRGYYQFTDKRYVPDFLEQVPLSIERRVRTTYLELPLKAKVKAEIIDGVKVFAEAGVGVSFNLSDLTKDKYDFYWISSADNNYTNSFFYEYRWFQTALNFGIGAEYEINSKFGIFAQLSFNHALTNTFSTNLEKLTGSNLQTNFIGVEVGIMH